MRPITTRHADRRRGVTLIEMLITVALLILIMAVLISIFSAATGSITAQRSYAALDQDLRRVEGLIRRDLEGVTARMTPPLDPADNLGYFTYGENALADAQGEDTDDYAAFTSRAPQGQPFSGTVVVPVTNPSGNAALVGQMHRVAVTSEFAEIVYFWRNGNLYRRVFLILPKEWQPRLAGGVGRDVNGLMKAGGGYNTSNTAGTNFAADNSQVANLYGVPSSWIGLNDVSARPSPFSELSLMANVPADPMAATDSYMPILNTLGDLTDRQNRAFNPRHTLNVFAPGGIPDDATGDDIPDYYPTLYPGAFNNSNPGGRALVPPPNLVNFDLLAFPYIYPNGYSQPDPFFSVGGGAIHSPNPAINAADVTLPQYPRVYNHNPLDLGDPLGAPSIPAETQTWWGFPTKKETMSSAWTDPVKRLNDPAAALFFNPPGQGGATPQREPQLVGEPAVNQQAFPLRPGALLPHMTAAVRGLSGEQPFNDGSGADTFTSTRSDLGFQAETWRALPEEDLILSGVRSFDIKALERRYYLDPTGTNAHPPTTQYVDLGYGAIDNDGDGINDFALGTPPLVPSGVPGFFLNTLTTFAHEGRMPPRVEDFRSDANWPVLRRNIGNSADNIVRMRRVWDTWSTTYSRTPDLLDPLQRPPFFPPVLPSYPAPYPVPLTGLQIQIRVVDPTNQRIKILTIRHDFSDRL